MADLAVAVTVDWLVSSVVHWSHGGGHRSVHSVVGNWVNSVGNNWGSMDGMSNDWSGMDGVGNNRGSMDGVGNWGSVVGGSNLLIRGV